MTDKATERTDAGVAAAIRETVRHLNALFHEAQLRGLEVNVRDHELRAIGDHVGCRCVEVAIRKVVDL